MNDTYYIQARNILRAKGAGKDTRRLARAVIERARAERLAIETLRSAKSCPVAKLLAAFLLDRK